MIDVLTYYLDNQAPAIVRRISGQGGDFDLQPGMNFRIKVRNRYDDTVLIDEQMSPDFDADTLTYEPQPTDFTEEGVYRAWIEIDLGGSVMQDTDEFDLNVFAHAPGQGVRTGAVARAARGMVPDAWESVRGVKDYGDVELQRQIELAKLRVIRSPVTMAAENSLDPRVVDYIAKKVLVDGVIETAIDIMRNKVVTRTARGNSEEVESYPDRIRSLENQLQRFEEDLEAQLAEVEEIIGAPTGPLQQGPELDIADPLITPGLESFPSPYATPLGAPRRAADGWGIGWEE
jgi:hypothetical protein